jgi:hypothetical protein
MRTILTAVVVCFTLLSFGQDAPNDKLTDLAQAWSSFMFRNNPPKGFAKDLKSGMPENLQLIADFVGQTITPDNDLLKDKYLTLPDAASLKNLFIIRAVSNNAREEYKIDNNKLIDSLKAADISKNELVSNYYEVLFIAIGNKNKPFNMSRVNFNLNNYNLSNETEKGIFFLECMTLCGTTIWGYMNVVKPPNTATAYDYIKKYPKFNSLNYYQFTNLYFPDFETEINDKRESYKAFYLDKYYELLLNHLTVLQEEGAKEETINDLILGSILKDRALYKYSKKKDRLEKILKVHKTE